MVINQRLIAQLNSDTDCTLLHVHADDAVCMYHKCRSFAKSIFFIWGPLLCWFLMYGSVRDTYTYIMSSLVL